METSTFADGSTGATDTPPTWSESIARRLADVVGPTGDGESGLGADETAINETETVEQGGRSRSEPPALEHGWVLIAPLAVAVVLSAASALVEPNPLRTGTSPSGLLAFAVLIPFLGLCAAGTVVLVRDAARLRDAGADWSPNPWHYVVPSAVVLAALHAYRLVGSTGEIASKIDGVVGVVVGSLVVALVASSILAGPAYLLRRRRLDSD